MGVYYFPRTAHPVVFYPLACRHLICIFSVHSFCWRKLLQNSSWSHTLPQFSLPVFIHHSFLVTPSAHSHNRHLLLSATLSRQTLDRCWIFYVPPPIPPPIQHNKNVPYSSKQKGSRMWRARLNLRIYTRIKLKFSEIQIESLSLESFIFYTVFHLWTCLWGESMAKAMRRSTK